MTPGTPGCHTWSTKHHQKTRSCSGNYGRGSLSGIDLCLPRRRVPSRPTTRTKRLREHYTLFTLLNAAQDEEQVLGVDAHRCTEMMGSHYWMYCGANEVAVLYISRSTCHKLRASTTNHRPILGNMVTLKAYSMSRCPNTKPTVCQLMWQRLVL